MKHLFTTITALCFLFFFSNLSFGQSGVTPAPKTKDEKKVAPKTNTTTAVKKTDTESPGKASDPKANLTWSTTPSTTNTLSKPKPSTHAK